MDLVTTADVQSAINGAYTIAPLFVNHAWLAVDVTDAQDVEVAGATITTSPSATRFTYIDCVGFGVATATVAPCTRERAAMYIAYFDTATEVSVTYDGNVKIAPVRIGELTFVGY